MPNVTLNGYEFYDAPKNAGTTVRMWLKHYEGALPDFSGQTSYYNLASIGHPKAWVGMKPSEESFFVRGEPQNRRWCIKRDPVDRFVSAYTDKVLREQLVDWSVDACLAMVETGQMMQIALGGTEQESAARHFIGQTSFFGSDRNYFDHVFDIAQMDLVREFCEDIFFKMPLPPLHARNQSWGELEKISLSTAQRQRAERVFASDYDAGWC